tara:strand:- start:901 stop:1653 length:753 start_codon:yes stop_codon:yes gene_type:complete
MENIESMEYMENKCHHSATPYENQTKELLLSNYNIKNNTNHHINDVNFSDNIVDNKINYDNHHIRNIDTKHYDTDNFNTDHDHGLNVFYNHLSNDGFLKYNSMDIKEDFSNHTSKSDLHNSNTCSSSSKTCSSNTCGSGKLYPVMNPKFNLREASKQCLLLEDHLNNVNKRCLDCIKKHMLMIDGLLEEAISLEQNNEERLFYRNKHDEWCRIEKDYVNSNNIDDISKRIRQFRKPMVYESFDLISEYES